MLTYPFTRDLNLTTPRRRTLERLFVSSDPRSTFLARNTYQIVPLRHAIHLLRRFSINSVCLAIDTPRSGIQKKKNALNGYHRTDF